MDKGNWEAFSIKLSECMDLMGYSYSMIKYRQEMNQNMDNLFNKNKIYTHYQIITTGSKGEGTAKYFESDIDRLVTLDGICCVNCETDEGPGFVPASNPNIPENMTVFEVEIQGCSPGYARLRLEKPTAGHHRKLVELSLVYKDGMVFIDNSFPKASKQYELIDVNAVPISPQNKTGPSVPYGNAHICYDFVNGFTYENKELLLQWTEMHSPSTKKSDHWPPLELVHKVCQTKGQLVPVANKSSQYPNTEWRICFTDAELLLVRSLNECQIKVYILLKMVSKRNLKLICKDISSYAMKNIVMWIAAWFSMDHFKTDSLCERFYDALKFLKECIELGELKSFMIPGRNLFENRISRYQKIQLLSEIENLIDKDGGFINGLGDLVIVLNATDSETEKLRKKRKLRDKVEVLLLKKNVEFKKIEQEWFRLNRQVRFKSLAEKHEAYNDFDKQIKVLLNTEDTSTYTEMSYDFHNRLKQVLS